MVRKDKEKWQDAQYVEFELAYTNISKDATERFPEILQWWDRRYDLSEEELMRYGFC